MYAYNPRKKSYKQLEKSLVGNDRWDVLNNILQELAVEDGEGPKQHWIIIGPRGIGKSHLMTLLYYKVKEDRVLSKLWIPVLFPEDLRMAGNLTKFLERVVNEILLELEQEKKPIPHDLKQKITHISKLPLFERAESLFSIIACLHQKAGKFILLLIENLQQLLGKKINPIEQKKLRAFLQTSDAVLIIGSATTIFNALHDHSHPFYHFFHIRRLEDLNFDNMKNLIVNLLSESERPELIKEIRDKNARLKTLYSFTGGNPRMAVFLTDIIKTEAPDEMLELMDGILDQLTPYFESILNDTPDYLEEIINTLAAFEPAQSPREIAEHLEVPQATIRNYLKQLKETGYVRIAFSKGKSNYYCLNEYLYRIWYQMRDSGHREETRWLMELLLMLYSPDDIFKEKHRIDSHAELKEISYPYKKYILQAADFIGSNPEFCKVIELSVDSIIMDEERATISQEEKELIKEVIRYRDQNQKERAIKKCKEILNINPESEDAYGFWGDCLREQDRYDEAILKFKKAIDLNPKSEQAYWGWGACLREQDRYDEAIVKLKQAIKMNSKSFSAYGAMGDCFKYLSQYDEAEKQYKKAIEINSTYSDAYRSLGHCLLLKKQYGKAIGKLKKATEIDPNDSNSYELWGSCLFDLKSYDEAIEQYQKAIDLNPKSEQAYRLWGECLRRMGRSDEAIGKLKKATEIDPNDSNSYELWGSCLFALKSYDEAIEQYQKAIDLNPKSEQAYRLWGECLRRMGRSDEAIEKFKKAIDINPNNEDSYGLWGDCLREQDRYDEAIEQYQKAIDLNPKSEKAYRLWGECLRRMGRSDEAIEKFKKLIDLNPKSEQAYWGWGACLREQDRYDEAIVKFKQAIKMNSKSFSAYGAMGDCYRELGQYDEAEKNYKKATGINEKYEDAYGAWGYSLREQERYDEAIEKFKKAIELNPKSENIYWVLGDCLNKLARYEEAVELFEKHLSDSQDSYVIHSYGDCLMGMKRYGEALGQFERLMHDEPEYYQVYLSYGQLLEKKRKKEHAIYAYLKYINIGSGTLTSDFDFQKPYKEHMLPLIKTLTPGKYIKQFYTPEQNGKISSPQLSILLILSGKYDIVSEHIQEIVKTFLKKENEEKNDFDLFIFTIKLSIWLKLCEGNIHNATRLIDLYLEYIKALKTTKQKEDEVSRLSLGLLRIQINFTIDANNILKILNRLDDEDGVPFNNVFLKVWTCISEPDSVDAQKYLNEKAIAEVVKELKE